MGQSKLHRSERGFGPTLDQPRYGYLAQRNRRLSIRRGLTARERRIIQLRVQGRSCREIAEDVGSSKSRVFLVLKRLAPELKHALELAGYGLHEAVGKMVEMTDATKTVIVSYKGAVTYERQVADNPVRLRAREIMLNVHGIQTRGRHDTESAPSKSEGIKVEMALNPQLIKELREAGIPVEVYGPMEPTVSDN